MFSGSTEWVHWERIDYTKFYTTVSDWNMKVK